MQTARNKLCQTVERFRQPSKVGVLFFCYHRLKLFGEIFVQFYVCFIILRLDGLDCSHHQFSSSITRVGTVVFCLVWWIILFESFIFLEVFGLF